MKGSSGIGNRQPRELDSLRAGLDLLESATALLRTAKASDWVYYYLGTLPFLWFLLWFWAEMSRSASAGRRLWSSAVVLALGYLGMKVGQALFTQRLLLILRSEPRRWTWEELLRMVRRISVLQASSLAVTGVALCLGIPAAWTIAFYHHAQCACDPDQKDVGSVARMALAQSQLWPRQNHSLLAVHSLFQLIVFVNIWAILAFLPQLVHTLSGVEIGVSLGAASPLNSTLLAAAAATTLALADPWLKAAYAVRAFRAESRATGRDLSVAWKQSLPRKALGMLVLLLILLLPQSSWAQVESAAPGTPARTEAESQKLNRQLTEIMERPEFALRMPREAAPEEQDEPPATGLQTWLRDTLRYIWHAVQRLVLWLAEIMSWILGLNSPNAPVSSPATGAWGALAERSTVLLGGIAVVLPILVLLRRRWRSRPLSPVGTSGATPEPVTENEGVEASKLPESEWLSQAEGFLRAGERRLAVRSLFLGNLAHLIQRGRLVASPHKSVGDYRRDLARRAHALPKAHQGYCDTAQIFEAVWYGNHPVTDQDLSQFSLSSALLRQDV